MRGPDDAPDFVGWLKDAYHNRPAPRHDVARELYEQELAHRAAARERDWRTQEVAVLGRRVRALERMLLGADGRPNGPLVKGMGDVTARVIAGERKATADLIDEKIESALAARCPLNFKGVHDQAAGYLRGDCVSHSGALWVCLADCSGAEPPNKSACWKLAVKSPDGRPPAIA